MSSSGSLLPGLVRGMVAGAVGTVALTMVEQLDMKVTGRKASNGPGQVGAHLLAGSALVPLRNDEPRLSTMVALPLRMLTWTVMTLPFLVLPAWPPRPPSRHTRQQTDPPRRH